MIDPSLMRRLQRIVGGENVSASRAATEVYSYDASLAVAAPDAIVLPGDTGQTADVLRAAAEARVPCVARGFGTNLSGGSVAADGGLIVELSRLDRILEICPQGRYAVVQPGVTNLELQNALAPAGMFYAPDPASQKVSTLGGNVGENSGGPHCLKYGVTTNHVLGMTVVLAGGEVMQIGSAALDPPGYDLRGVLVGSEGTLAIVTELIVRVLPRPESVVTLLVVYDDVADAARSVSDVIGAGIVPATLEMMDATVIRAVEQSKPCGYPLDAAAVLIAEVDGPAADLDRQAARIRELCEANHCREVRRAADDGERDLLWAGRRGAFGAIARLAPNYLVADCTVPRTLLPEALERVAAIAGKYELSHGNVFHAGDGNLHPLLLFDSRDPQQVERVHEAGREIMEACVELGGTISGEHGIGMEKSDAMRLICSGDDLHVQRQLREAFDPHGLLNPGKILPPPLDTYDGEAVELSPNLHDGEAVELPPNPPEREWTDGGDLIPTDAAEACAMVARAVIDGVALLPLGAGTRSHGGIRSQHAATGLRSVGLSEVVEHDPPNQVIAVGAGTTLDSLQDLLAEQGQWLPLRPPPGGNRSLGGIAATGACGAERLRYGAPRDLLLGLKFVCGNARLISTGGRVVKNVAGYDLTRLLVGSAGTLGLITELTFRVASLPQCCTAVSATGSFSQCADAAATLLQTKLEPNLVVGVPGRPDLTVGDGGTWQLTAAFEGFAETVQYQLERCETLLSEADLNVEDRSDYAVRRGPCAEWFDALEELPLLVQIDLPPDRVGAFVSACGDLLYGAAVTVDFGCGRIRAAMADAPDAAWDRIGQEAAAAGGHATAEKAPEEFARRHDVFGLPRGDWPLMHRIKWALDPHQIFAPGRLPGGA